MARVQKDTIKKLATEGVTMMVVTHEMNFAQRVASKVFLWKAV